MTKKDLTIGLEFDNSGIGTQQSYENFYETKKKNKLKFTEQGVDEKGQEYIIYELKKDYLVKHGIPALKLRGYIQKL